MCVVSAVMDQWRPHFPSPNVTPNPYPWPPGGGTVPGRYPVVPKSYSQDDLQRLIDAFRDAVKSAKVLDEITGQPDCEDPEKAKLIERVAELEAQLEAIRSAASPG